MQRSWWEFWNKVTSGVVQNAMAASARLVPWHGRPGSEGVGELDPLPSDRYPILRTNIAAQVTYGPSM